MLSDSVLGTLGLLGVLVLLLFRNLGRKRKARLAEVPPENAILVDGSNVMHWGDGASVRTLSRVLRDLEAKAYAPIVFFDANVGYVLDDCYYNETRLAPLIGVPREHICVVDKGVVADEAILSFATDFGLRVVTNDRYRDWRVTFPHADQKGTLIGGTWRQGSVVWRGKL